MKATRPLILVAAVLALLVSACSQPEDFTIPTLEPQFGSGYDDIGYDVSVVPNGRVFVLSQEYGTGSAYYDEYHGNEYYAFANLNVQMYDASGNLASTTPIDELWCWLGPSNCDEPEIMPRGLYADAKGFQYALYSTNYNYYGDDYAHYITKLDALGHSYTYQVGGGSDDVAKSSIDAAVDGNGNIYVAKGDFTRSWNSDGSFRETYTNVVAKYSTSGSLLWQRTSTVGTPFGITVSSSGSVYVVGTTGVARYSNSGNLTWSKAANNSKGVLENAGDIDVSGSYIYTRSGKDIRKYDGTGKQLWVKTQSGLNTIMVQNMDGDGSGNLYLSGKYDADARTSVVNINAYVRKLSTSGSILWTKTYGTLQYDDARGIATITGSKIYTTGETQGGLAHSNRGGRDGYLRKQNSTGGSVWTR